MEGIAELSSISASWECDCVLKILQKKQFCGINYEKGIKLSDI